ncbi:MAG: HIT domain-containing protein [Pseudomonadales bacterium]|nr:HIT domain-containing protein [Pseudomonadales bacterium]
MSDFTLDSKLANDCFVLGSLTSSQLLLMNNSLVPWFILVPQVNVTELYQLDHAIQADLQEEINQLSEFISQEFQSDKLNVAALGNIVSQLHVHVVGRKKSDFCWPNVVWGAEQQEEYSKRQVQSIVLKLKDALSMFKPATLEDYSVETNHSK